MNERTVAEQMREDLGSSLDEVMPLPEPKNGVPDLSQRVKTLVNAGLTAATDTLTVDARSTMQEYVEHIMDLRLKIIADTTKELDDIVKLVEANRQALHELLATFGKNQVERSKIISKALDQQAEVAIGLKEVFSKVSDEIEQT